MAEDRPSTSGVSESLDSGVDDLHDSNQGSSQTLHVEGTPIAIDPQWREDNHDDDTDSAYGDQVSTFTASLSSSVYDYQFENGRRYHAYDAGRYPMPNDEMELDRMDFFHSMMLALHNKKLHLAPITSPHRVLDVGTGTGIWAIDMGDAHPEAEVIGNDLSPIQPASVPPNVRFIVDNIEYEWVPEPPYDFIHCRYMSAAIKDWPALCKQVYSHTKPGGWVEFSDYDVDFKSYDNSLNGTALQSWIKDILKSCEMMGVEASPGPHLKRRLIDAGFTDVQEHVFQLPTGPWPWDKRLKILGLYSAIHLLKGVEGFTLALFTRFLGWSPARIQVLLSQVRKDINSPAVHSYQNYYVVYGRRPDFASDTDLPRMQEQVLAQT